MANNSNFSEAIVKYTERNKADMKDIIAMNLLPTLKEWYEKISFIPQPAVVMTLPIEYAEKYKDNAKKWFNIMLMVNTIWPTEEVEKRENVIAILKAAVCFGVFDYDDAGYNLLLQMISIPRYLTKEEFNGVDKIVDNYGYTERNKLIEVAASEGFEIDETKIIKLLDNFYKTEWEDRYKLTLDSTKYPKTSVALRDLLEVANLIQTAYVVMTDQELRLMFGSFDVKYKPDFRYFFMKYFKEILECRDIKLISSIHSGFENFIKENSGRKLTLERAFDFVREIKYTNVESGNEELAILATKTGKTQEEFDKLQKLYNEQKTRNINSIPRIEGEYNGYTYEILKLDDPLAIFIGTFTDCCQELGNNGESCMEHSVIDKNGRVFVIRDDEGRIVAQSWVWRNKNTLCFDNIEIPKRIIDMNKNNSEFKTDILKIYQKVSIGLKTIDFVTYDRLYKEGKISKDKYACLLSKVTVGLGQTDISEEIIGIDTPDKNIVRPLPFHSFLNNNIYLYTGDSDEQYILAGDSKTVPPKTEEILYPYSDDGNVLANSLSSVK